MVMVPRVKADATSAKARPALLMALPVFSMASPGMSRQERRKMAVFRPMAPSTNIHSTVFGQGLTGAGGVGGGVAGMRSAMRYV